MLRRLAVLVVLLTVGGAAPAWAVDESALSVEPSELNRSLTCSPGLDNAAVDPVVLVPAFSTDRESYGGNYLEVLPARGIPTCSVSLDDRGFGDLQRAAEFAVHAIRTASRRSGRTVRVLGHQHGAIDLLLALRFWPDVPARVSDYVSLATPHQGTRLARDTCDVGSCAPSVWQIAQGSALIAEINRELAPAGPSYTSITTVFDEVIVPQPAASMMRGARNITLQDVCPGRPVEHFSILGDLLTRRLVLDAFANPGPADPARLVDPCGTPPGEGGPSGFSAESASFAPNFVFRNLTEAVGAEPALRCPVLAGCARAAVAPRPCTSRRRFAVRLPRGTRDVVATLAGRRVRVRSGRVLVDLRGRPRGSVTLRLRGRTAAGRTYRATRTYRTCTQR